MTLGYARAASPVHLVSQEVAELSKEEYGLIFKCGQVR